MFPRAAAIVHQGGIGTTAEALRSGRPMLVVPYAHDQPDNAARAVRLGLARRIPRARYDDARAAAVLRELLADSRAIERAAEVGARIRGANGAETAAVAIAELARSR
jgi:UDP:flavonoid glycosyltransferase YjiC (YdhE family)